MYDPANRGHGPKTEAEGCAYVIFVLLLLFAGAALFRALESLVAWTGPRLSANASTHWPKAIAAMAVLGAGGLFFWVRKLQPFIYGITEVGFGVMMGVRSLFGAEADKRFSLEVMIGVVGAVYLVVRGIDNATKRPNAQPQTRLGSGPREQD